MMRNRVIAILLSVAGFFLAGGLAYGQATPAPQPLVIATSGGTFNGQPVTIASAGVQLTTNVSVGYEYLFNPSDSSQPHVGSGVVNYTFCICSLLPASLKKKLLVDSTNYNLTLQGGAGVESLFNGIGAPRSKHIVGDFGASPSYPLPGGHVQIAPLYKILLKSGGKTDRVMGGTLNFTFKP